jgi:hypothetical protein
MKSQCNALRISYTEQGKPELTLSLTCSRQEIAAELQELRDALSKDKLLDVDLKIHRNKRSLDSNSYAWVLITKIADALRANKEDVYIEMLKRYGQRERELISVVAEGVETIFRALDNHCVIVGDGEVNGKQFKHIAILIGSSKYDSKQMSILIDGIVSEAKELDIEVVTPEELARMNEEWGAK